MNRAATAPRRLRPRPSRALPICALFLALGGLATAAESPEKAAVEIKGLVARLSSPSYLVRHEAFKGLFEHGDAALAPLGEAAGSRDPETARLAKRLVFLIRWRLHPDTARGLGPFWDDFERQPPQERIRRLLIVRRLDRKVAMVLLRRVAEIDPSPEVRAEADQSLRSFLLRDLNAMNLEGVNLMRLKQFDEAEAKFRAMLELDPENDIAYYNLACCQSLRGEIDGAFQLLEKAVACGYDDADYARHDPDFAPLRQADPQRFERILSAIRK